MSTTNRISLTRRFRSALRHSWDDQVRAQRALLRVTPYDDYLRTRGR